MKRTLILMLSTFAIASASPNGADIFKKCGICHGEQGEKHSLNITKFIAGMDQKKLVNILHEYKKGKRDSYGLGSVMHGQAKQLSDKDISAVATYISKLPPVEPPLIQEKKTTNADGAEIFKKCAICHGDMGQKQSLGVSRKIAGMNTAEVIKDLKEYRAGERSTYGYGTMMKGQATKLSDEQMKAVATHVESLTPIQTEEEKKDAMEETKKLTPEQIEYNTFMNEYFKNSKDPNETFEAAKQKYKEHQAKKNKEK